jgi:hypothetical protein
MTFCQDHIAIIVKDHLKAKKLMIEPSSLEQAAQPTSHPAVLVLALLSSKSYFCKIYLSSNGFHIYTVIFVDRLHCMFVIYPLIAKGSIYFAYCP